MGKKVLTPEQKAKRAKRLAIFTAILAILGAAAKGISDGYEKGRRMRK